MITLVAECQTFLTPLFEGCGVIWLRRHESVAQASKKSAATMGLIIISGEMSDH